MDDYGKDFKGTIKIQSVTTLPAFVSAAGDERRLIYCEDTEKFYIGGSTAWIEVGKVTAPGGADGDVQFNDGGVLGGDSGFVYVNGKVGIGTATPSHELDLGGGSLGRALSFFDYTILGSAYSSAATILGNMVMPVLGALGYAKSTGITIAQAAIELKEGVINFATKASDDSAKGTAWDMVANTKMKILNNGNVGIGTMAPATALDVNGTVTATLFNATSSRKLKKNIKPFKKNALKIVNSVKIKEFNLRKDKEKAYRIGFIAEDTDPILSGKDRNIFDLNNTIGVLLKAVQELSEKVAILERDRVK